MDHFNMLKADENFKYTVAKNKECLNIAYQYLKGKYEITKTNYTELLDILFKHLQASVSYS